MRRNFVKEKLSAGCLLAAFMDLGICLGLTLEETYTLVPFPGCEGSAFIPDISNKAIYLSHTILQVKYSDSSSQSCLEI